MNTRNPGRTFSSNVELSAGSLGLTQTRGNIAGPLSATLCGRLSAFYTGRDGTIENIGTGLALNNQNKVGARAELYFEPGDALSLRLIARPGRGYAELSQGHYDAAISDLTEAIARPTTISCTYPTRRAAQSAAAALLETER